MAPNKKRKDFGQVPETERIIKRPGLETSHPHIGTMFMSKGDESVANDVTRQLKPELQHRIVHPTKRRSRRGAATRDRLIKEGVIK